MLFYSLTNIKLDDFVGVKEAELQKYLDKGYFVYKKFNMIDFKQIDKPRYRFYAPVNGLEGDYYGYGTAWKMMYTALQDNLVQVSSQENTKDSVFFIFCPPSEFLLNVKKVNRLENQKIVYMFAWECDALAKDWVEAINQYADIVVTPTPFYIDVYKNNGINKPILLWQHGVNRAFDKYKQREYKKGDNFYFFTYNAGEQRKGWDVVLQAFEEEFEGENNVKLIAKNNGKTCAGWFDLSLARFNSNRRNNIERYQEYMTFDQLIDLSHKSHCFLFPAFGEGYALPVSEMMLTGLPCILTKAHRFLDLPDNTYLPVEVTKEQGRRLYNIGNWWRPNLDSLKKQMRFVYENYNQALEIGDNGYKYTKEFENTDTFTKDFLQQLDLTLKSIV